MTYSTTRFLSTFAVLSSLFVHPMRGHAADRPFTLGTTQNPNEVLPHKQYSGQTEVLRGLLFPPILYVQKDGRVRCNLCKDVPVIESRKGAESGTYSITLELKKDMKWGDGTPITPEDVKFTLKTMARALYPSGEHPVLPIRRIDIDKDEKRKITLLLRHRRSDAFQLFAISLLPAQHAQEVETALSNPSRSLDLIKLASFTYGPYRVASTSAQSWQLVSNEKTNWDKKPDQPIEVRFFPRVDTLAEAVKRNEIDQSDELSWGSYEAIKKSFPDLASKYQVTSNPSNNLQVLLLNLHSPVLVNPQLRQALYFAINRDDLNKTAYQGLAEVGGGILSSSFASRLDLKREASYNPKLAAQILDQSGWTKSSENGGVRISDGQRLVVTLSCPAGRLDEHWLSNVKTELNTLGIRLELEHPEEKDFMKKVVSERRFKDLACTSWDLPPLSVPNNIFHSLAIPNRENNYFGANYSAWDQHVVDKLLDNMLREIDLHRFTKEFGRLEKQFLADLPAIPLVFEPKVTLVLKTPLSRPSEELSRVLQNPAGPKKL
ncbi:MAG: hypothetical protein H7249_17245 [Chitinophagaceae bacterium]|nr:hypothetical protein [Oligoflexus sp.]